MNKSFIFSAVLLLASAININAEKSIDQAILDSDFKSISNNAEIKTGLTEKRKNHCIKLAQDAVKTREAETKSWVPYKGSVFLNSLGIWSFLTCKISIKIDNKSEFLKITGDGSKKIEEIIEGLKKTPKELRDLSAILAGICFYIAYNYKQSFYRNSIAIKAILENAPVIEVTTK